MSNHKPISIPKNVLRECSILSATAVIGGLAGIVLMNNFAGKIEAPRRVVVSRSSSEIYYLPMKPEVQDSLKIIDNHMYNIDNIIARRLQRETPTQIYQSMYPGIKLTEHDWFSLSETGQIERLKVVAETNPEAVSYGLPLVSGTR